MTEDELYAPTTPLFSGINLNAKSHQYLTSQPIKVDSCLNRFLKLKAICHTMFRGESRTSGGAKDQDNFRTPIATA
jgi:hypothetical protein